MKAPALKIGRVELSNVEDGCAVTQVVVTDGREFSLLTATPDWFERRFAELGLKYYFGAQILFLKRLDDALARQAAQAMLAAGDRWLCRYDTPRRTLPQVLAEFKAKHGPAPSL